VIALTLKLENLNSIKTSGRAMAMSMTILIAIVSLALKVMMIVYFFSKLEY